MEKLKIFKPLIAQRSLLKSRSSTLLQMALSCVRHQHEGVDNVPELEIQFPQLPKQWEKKYIPGQMYKYQKSLPKIPLPPLQQTLKKYINGIQHLVTEEEFERTRNIVADFGKPGGIGEKLQKELLEKAEKEENWVNDWFSKEEFLGHRIPVVTNSNPCINFYDKPFGDRESFVRKAANTIIAAMKWSMLIHNEALPPDTYRKIPLCMEQHKSFSMCRIPGKSVDTVRKTPFTESRHVIVIRNGHLFKLDLLYECPDGTLALPPPDHIVKQLHGILDVSPEHCEHPVGVLTSEQRDNWYHTRQKLVLDPVNRHSLDTIETAQFTFSLDELAPSTNYAYTSLEDQKEMIERAVHGGGSQKYTCNRWFDTSRQIVIGGSGWLGIQYEHSYSDGVTTLAAITFVYNYVKNYDSLTDSSPVPTSALQSFRLLEWNISPEVANDIQAAKQHIDKLIEDTDVYAAIFKDFGTDFFKSMKLSFDSFIQTAMILAYYRLHKNMGPVYEAGTLRFFNLGRFSRIRNDSNETYNFINIMDDSNSPVSDKINALKAAMKVFLNAVTECTQGQDLDNHLTGLEVMAREKDLELEIFKDPSFKKAFNFAIISSQITLRGFMEGSGYHFMVFNGTYNRDGYSLCYSPEEKQMVFTTVSFLSSPESDSKLFTMKFMEALREMKELMLASKQLT